MARKLPYRPELRLTATEHHGYRYLVAYFADKGAMAEDIKKRCAEAAKAEARLDVLFRDEVGEWVTRRDIVERSMGARLDDYAATLLEMDEVAKKAAQR